VIGISLLTLVPGVSGGSETYVRALVDGLGKVGERDYRVYLPRLAPDAGGGLPATVVRSYRSSPGGLRRRLAMLSALARRGPLLREMEVERLSVLHFPLTVMLPRPPAGLAVVTTIHDLQHEFYPRFFGRLEIAYRKLFYNHLPRRSELLITPSRFVAETVGERLRFPPERIRVIHHGIDHDRFRPAGVEREPLLLFPAARWPHKNHDRLLEAFALLRRQRPELRLVLTGRGNDLMPPREGVEARGHVSLAELAELYRRASVLVFPSLYEGFGQPPLEAMACGLPVACSDIPVLREICGDAARFFDPTGPEAIAEAVTEVLDRPGDLVERGLERAALFTWERSAREHERAYAELGG
jgi:glycosyltransferase involved in cell wall biosynthesis